MMVEWRILDAGFPLRNAIAGVLFCAGIANAAGYPDRPIRMLVPSAPGGGTDNVARIVGPKLSEILGQQVIIDNRAGAGGSIAAQLASKAPANGYTLLATFATHATNPAIMKDLSYDIERDFLPISLVVVLPNLLVANPSLPVRNVSELIKLARAKPGEVQFASGSYGASSHLSMELFAGLTKTKMISVPFKGVGPALTGVIAGEVPLMIGSMLSALPHVRNRRLVGLGVTSAKRSSAAPDIRTIAEAGVPGYEADNWSGLMAPAGTPREIVMKLHTAITQTMSDAEISARFMRESAEPAPSRTPEDFGAMIKIEVTKWTKVARDAGLKPQ
jgi:tripartite-type tricarboxylate transporter receptor subunit TctC